VPITLLSILRVPVAVNVRYITDPGCIWSWTIEPVVRRLMTEFGDNLSWTFVMGGLARDISEPGEYVEEWLDVAAETGVPNDPGLWLEGPIASTYPACMAVIAASAQAPDRGYGYLRAVREGLVCFRRKLDTTEALVEEARGAGLDVKRFRIDLGSHGTVEEFGHHLEEARGAPDELKAPGKGRVSFPSIRFGEDHWVPGPQPYEAYEDAARAAGAEPSGGEPPGVQEALRRFGRMSPQEVEAVCGLPAPRAHAELWGLVSEWKAQPVRVLGGHLFAPAPGR
jgi:protein-disulfide isomerase-like protein with CxxC motif